MANKEKKKLLETQYEKNSFRADLFAYLVIAGLAVEIAGIIIIRPPFWEAFFSILGSALIVIGVWGEIIFGRWAKVAGDGIVAEANASAARALERAAILEKEAADARARTAEIERATQWRRVSPEQIDIIVRELRQKIPRTVTITIKCVNDPEAIMFADQLVDLLIKAIRTEVERLALPMPANGVLEFGLRISSQPEEYSNIVEDAFNKAKIPITKWVTAFGGSPRMTLYVGHKPIYDSKYRTSE